MWKMFIQIADVFVETAVQLNVELLGLACARSHNAKIIGERVGIGTHCQQVIGGLNGSKAAASLVAMRRSELNIELNVPDTESAISPPLGASGFT